MIIPGVKSSNPGGSPKFEAVVCRFECSVVAKSLRIEVQGRPAVDLEGLPLQAPQ